MHIMAHLNLHVCQLRSVPASLTAAFTSEPLRHRAIKGSDNDFVFPYYVPHPSHPITMRPLLQLLPASL